MKIMDPTTGHVKHVPDDTPVEYNWLDHDCGVRIGDRYFAVIPDSCVTMQEEIERGWRTGDWRDNLPRNY